MRIHSGVVHYYASALIKDSIIMIIFDCRIKKTAMWPMVGTHKKVLQSRGALVYHSVQ